MRSGYADGDADVVNSSLCASGVSGINWQRQRCFLPSELRPLCQCQPKPPTGSGLITHSVCVCVCVCVRLCVCAAEDAESLTTYCIFIYIFIGQCGSVSLYVCASECVSVTVYYICWGPSRRSVSYFSLCKV